MDKLITVKEMRERYGCSNPTARKYLRQCIPHMEDPLVAPEWAVKEWEEKRTVVPHERRRRVVIDPVAQYRDSTGRIIVPRHR